MRYDNDMEINLQQWARDCAKTLGMASPRFVGLKDQKLDTYSCIEITQILEELIREIDPQVIFTHHGGDVNKDHQVIFEATLVAARPLPKSSVRTIYTYETISSTEWASTDYYSRFQPNTFFDITETLDLKIKAFSHYISEVREYPHPRSFEGIAIRNKDWGARVGVKAAEPFHMVRSLF